jgi:predicted nucleic acid-binding protein
MCCAFYLSIHSAWNRRVNARLWADMAAAGCLIRAHDLQLAATALALGWSVATYNASEFTSVPGLVVHAPMEPGSRA